MITDLYKYFDYDLSKMETKLLRLIRKGWALVCIWTCGSGYIIPLPTDDPQQKYVAGFYLYTFDDFSNKIRQIREEISQDITGEVYIERGARQRSLVPPAVFKNMIFNAYSSPKKSTFNPETDYMYADDFFIQWTINEKEPDRMILLEPAENRTSGVFEEEKWKEAEQYILHWADRHPEYRVSPSIEHVRTVERALQKNQKQDR